MSTVNRRWLLAERPSGHLKDSDFSFVTEPVPQPGPGEFVVKVTHLSFDPTQRGWLAGDTYITAVKIGEVVRAAGWGRVVASKPSEVSGRYESRARSAGRITASPMAAASGRRRRCIRA